MPVVSLPAIVGRPVRLEVRRKLVDHRGPVHGGAFLRERRIIFDAELTAHPEEFSRIFVHELFHFVWLRLGNPRRASYEALLRTEIAGRVRGELGWSAGWRKLALQPADVSARTRGWREYVCESFCDSAAWMFSGVPSHPEYTLTLRFRPRRRRWFYESDLTRQISV